MDELWSSYFLLLLLASIFATLTQAISPSQPTNSHAISAATLGFSPVPTDPPYLMGFASPSERQDLKRLAARQRGPGVCAYVSGIQTSSLTCSPGMECAVNANGAAGCCQAGNLANCVLPTTCLPYTSLAYCDMYCQNNPYIRKCNYAYSECFTLEVQFPVSTYYQYDCWTAPGMLTALGSYTDQPGASSDVAPPLMTVTATAVVTASGGGGNTNNNNNNNVNNININLQSATVAPAGGGGGPLVKTAGAVGRRGNVWFGCVVTLVLLFVVG